MNGLFHSSGMQIYKRKLWQKAMEKRKEKSTLEPNAARWKWSEKKRMETKQMLIHLVRWCMDAARASVDPDHFYHCSIELSLSISASLSRCALFSRSSSEERHDFAFQPRYMPLRFIRIVASSSSTLHRISWALNHYWGSCWCCCFATAAHL